MSKSLKGKRDSTLFFISLPPTLTAIEVIYYNLLSKIQSFWTIKKNKLYIVASTSFVVLRLYKFLIGIF